MMQDMLGTLVSESEVAADLGFADVTEMRRWETAMGQKVGELEEKLRGARSDADSFLWHGRRMQCVLEKTVAFLSQLENPPKDLVLAIGVVTGKNVDWDNTLRDWFAGLDV